MTTTGFMLTPNKKESDSTLLHIPTFFFVPHRNFVCSIENEKTKAGRKDWVKDLMLEPNCCEEST